MADRGYCVGCGRPLPCKHRHTEIERARLEAVKR